jgi:hypothetical protein
MQKSGRTNTKSANRFKYADDPIGAHPNIPVYKGFQNVPLKTGYYRESITDKVYYRDMILKSKGLYIDINQHGNPVNVIGNPKYQKAVLDAAERFVYQLQKELPEYELAFSTADGNNLTWLYFEVNDIPFFYSNINTLAISFAHYKDSKYNPVMIDGLRAGTLVRPFFYQSLNTVKNYIKQNFREEKDSDDEYFINNEYEEENFEPSDSEEYNDEEMNSYKL